ncbi:hypothetical protein PHYC_03549 [Phycisphaerales bacterium]|nr:hypothetical protein PHYC_03549 [Phycisphaerales bacterium]
MTRRLTRPFPTLAALVLAAAGSMAALPPAALAQTGSPTEITERQPPLITIDFKGGTVAEYVAALRKSAGEEPVNVVLSKEAADVPLSTISLRLVSLDNAVQAISPAAGLANGEFLIQRIKPMAPPNSNAAAVYSVDYIRRERVVQTVSGRIFGDPQIQVFSLKPLTEPSPEDGGPTVTEHAETILTAIQTALDLDASTEAPRPDVKFHRESGLLIVRAIPAQLRAVEGCLERMRDDVDRRRAAIRVNRLGPEEMVERKAAVTRAEFELQQRKVECDLAEKNLTQLRTLRDSGNVSEGEYNKAEAELQKNRMMLAMSHAEIERARELLSISEARTTRSVDDRVEQLRKELADANRRLIEVSKRRDAGTASEKEEQAIVAEKDRIVAQLKDMIAKQSSASLNVWSAGPAILDLTDWPKDQYDQTLSVIRSIYSGSKNPPKIETPGGQRILVAGEQWQVESVVTIIREIGRARRLAEPTIGPAVQPKPGTGR